MGRLDFVRLDAQQILDLFVTKRDIERAGKKPIDPPPVHYRRTGRQIREWLEFGHKRGRGILDDAIEYDMVIDSVAEDVRSTIWWNVERQAALLLERQRQRNDEECVMMNEVSYCSIKQMYKVEMANVQSRLQRRTICVPT